MSEMTIERLQVEVDASSTSAAAGINDLTSSLEKLKNALKGGAGLNTFSKRLGSLNTALSSVSSANADTLDKVTRSLQSFSSIGNIKISSSVSSQITRLGSAVKSLSGTSFGSLKSLVEAVTPLSMMKMPNLNTFTSQLTRFPQAVSAIDGVNFSSLYTLAEAITPLSTLGKANLNSFISQLTRLPQAVMALDNVDLGNLGTQITQLVEALKPLSEMGKNNLTSFITQLSKLPAMMTTLQSVDMSVLTAQVQDLANAFAPLATQMQHISTGFAAFPARIQQLITSTTKLSETNNKASSSYVNLAAKIGLAVTAMRKLVNTLGSWITKSNKYIEDMNLFTASMGQYAEEAQLYAEKVGEIMGIDPGEWMRNQGLFMTLATGFGVVSKRAEIMSRNLTQLGYDISSFFNTSFEDSMAKLQSGLAGELEPLRRIGYDLSVARLQQEAYTLGIKKSVQTMTQAEKAELRYYAIMKQVTVAQGDMARTLNAPSNQLRILKAQVEQAARALGNIFIPALNAILPYAIALAKVVRMLANEIANLAGFTFPEVDYSGLDTIADGSVGDALDDAADQAKKLKNSLLGIDELNILSQVEDTEDGLGDLEGLGGLGFELPEYDFIGDAIDTKVDEIMAQFKPLFDWLKEGFGWVKDNFEEALATVMAIGAALLAWKIAEGVIAFLNFLNALKDANLLYNFGISLAGLGGFIDSWLTLKKYIQDLLENGPTLENIAGIISGAAGLLGNAFLLLGNLKIGGALLILQGISGLVAAIADIVENGFNLENVMLVIKNIGILIAGIGFFTGNLKLAGVGLMIEGVAILIPQLGAIWKGITTGDWSGVDKAAALSGALLLIGGIVTTIKGFNTIKDVTSIGRAGETIKTVSTATEQVTTGTSTLFSKLTSLAKSLAVGLIIVAEVAAAAILITGAIWVLGKELEQVGIAWQPVIDNGGTIAIAMGVGVAVLAAIGTVTALLGSVGTTLVVNLALGVAILAEIGFATGLFLVEIWAIGKGLDEIGKAWEPVLSNGKSIATAIGLGTALLVAIGVVTAALGVATVASAGTLPLAIALGTAILLEMGVATALFVIEIAAVGKALDEVGKAWEPVVQNGKTVETGIATGTKLLIAIGVVTAALGVATVAGAGLLPVAIGLGTALLVGLSAATILFTGSLVAVADEMSNNLSPALVDLNDKLPALSTNMNNFVAFMTEFAGYVVQYSKASSIAGLAATIDTIIGLFVTNPLQKLANDVAKVHAHSQTLNEKLNLAVPELETAIDLLNKYTAFIAEIERITQSRDNSSLSQGVFVNMKDVGANLVTGFVTGIESKASEFTNAGKTIITGFIAGVETAKNDALSKVKELSVQVVETFKNGSGRGIVEDFKEIGSRIVAGFKEGMPENEFAQIATTIVDAFNNRIASHFASSHSSMAAWGNEIKLAFFDSVSRSTFEDVASDVVAGFNDGVNKLYTSSRPFMKKWANDAKQAFKAELDSHSPSKVFYRIGGDSVLGYNNAVEDLGGTTKKIVTAWADSFTDVSPAMQMSVDTSALKYYDSQSFAKTISSNVSANTSVSVDDADNMKQAMLDALVESGLVEDMRRQADKVEQTTVQVGNRVITDTVVTQQRANGFRFTPTTA